MSHYRRVEKYPDQCDDANEDGILVYNDPPGVGAGRLVERGVGCWLPFSSAQLNVL